MKKSASYIAVFFTGLLLVFSISCKKKRAFNEENAQDTVDERMVMAECDEVVKDLNIVIMEQFLLRGKSSGSPTGGGTSSTSVCGVSVDSTQITSGIVTLNYNGSNCFSRSRTGSVKASIENYPLRKWKNQGAVLQIVLTGYKMTRGSDGKSIQLDGKMILTNESGGSWFELWYLNEPKLTYKLSAENVKMTFDKDNYGFVNIQRRLNYFYGNFITSCLVEGAGSNDGMSAVECWGENRAGEKFTAQVSGNYTWKTNCGAAAPIAGETKIKVEGRDYLLQSTFAVDKDGNNVSGQSSPCPYGWKASWTFKKKTNTRVLSFY